MRVEAIEQTKKEVEIDEFLFLRKLKSRWRRFGLQLDEVSVESKERLTIDPNGNWAFDSPEAALEYVTKHSLYSTVRMVIRRATDEELAIEYGFDAIGRAIASLPAGV